MKFGRVVILSLNSLGLKPSILRHSSIWWTAYEALLNKVRKNRQKKNPPLKGYCVTYFLKLFLISGKWHSGMLRYSVHQWCPFLSGIVIQRGALIKMKIKFSSYIRKFRMEQLQSHIWQRPPHIWGSICAFPYILGSPSSYMTLQLLHSEFPYILYEENFILFFISVLAIGSSWSSSGVNDTGDLRSSTDNTASNKYLAVTPTETSKSSDVKNTFKFLINCSGFFIFNKETGDYIFWRFLWHFLVP
jgi:hypothetical protein